MSLEALSRSDLAERAARSGSRFEEGCRSGKRISLGYLGREVRLSFPPGTLEPINGAGPLPSREEILILHYLEKAGGTLPTGQWTSFAEIPGGTFYHPVFLQRCRAPLVRHFGEDPERLLSLAGEEMGGKQWSFGDVGVTIQVLPRVSLGLVLWKGDAEFPPDGNILFDSSIIDYLPVEDIVILTETIIWKLVKKKGLPQSTPV
jgi:hypothetical protein